MNTTLPLPATQQKTTKKLILKVDRSYEEIENYYSVAGPDYAACSRKFNMHFGYCRTIREFFNLERMLDNMGDEVLDRLDGKNPSTALIADLGCGMGTVARQAALKFPGARMMAISIVDYQVKEGWKLTAAAGLHEKVIHRKDNFEALDLPDNYFDQAYALESACHAGGSNKELFISELARTLKKGGQFAIADGFLKTNENKLPRLAKLIHKKLKSCWALPGFANLDEFTGTLNRYGLHAEWEDISWKIAPSVMHVPWVVLKFLCKEWYQTKTLAMKRERWNNLIGPLLGMILGLYRNHFGYYIIYGKKR